MVHVSLWTDGGIIEQLKTHAVFTFSALTVTILGYIVIRQKRRMLRVKEENAAALTLVQTSEALREALSDCRYEIIKCGELPPGHGSAMDSMIAVDTSIRAVLPDIVWRYESESILTWAMMHEIAAAVLTELASMGQHDERLINLIHPSTPAVYPTDEQPASFEGRHPISIVFLGIEKQWQRVQEEKVRAATSNRCLVMTEAESAAVARNASAVDVL